MPQVKIHLELTLPLDRLTVNNIIALFQQILEQLVPLLISTWLRAWQEYELSRWLGPRWGGEQLPTPWACPGCGSQHGYYRRGSRQRVLPRSSLGRIEFPLLQVTCQQCGKTFAPLAEQLELAPYQSSTLEFRAHAAEAVCQVSYRRAADFISSRPLSSPVTATSIHRWVQNQGSQVTFSAEAVGGRTVLLDSTLVPAGRKDRGASLNLGVVLLDRAVEAGRPRLRKQVVALSVEEDWASTLRPLAQSQPERVLYDGDTELSKLLQEMWPKAHRQRCLWHLVRHLYWATWKDDLYKADCRPLQDRLQDLLYNSPNLPQAIAAYQALHDELLMFGLESGAQYLRIAQPSVFTFWTQPNGLFADRTNSEQSHALLATSPIEREMREVDRRTENGSRWSISGVRNLVALELIRRFDRQQWNALWRLPAPASALDVSVKVQAEMIYSLPIVNTT